MTIGGLITSVGLSQSGASNPYSANYQSYAYDIQSAIGAKRLDGNGLDGTVRIAFSLSPQGVLTTASVVQSSGHTTLDSQALDSLQAVTFPSAPANLSVSGKIYYCQFVFS